MSYERKKRISKVMRLIEQRKEISNREISELMQVSEMTIRRDLDLLERQGSVNRIHGGAVLADPNANMNYSYVLREHITKNTRQKEAIGIKAASLVKPNETLFLDAGTTIPFIAQNIKHDLPITVLCYTFPTAMEFYPRRDTNLILLGGVLHRDSNIIHSEESYKLINKTRADTAFISTGGLDPEMGLTTFFDYEAAIKREMIRSARRIVLCADSTKFGIISVTHFAELDQVDMIITDDGLSEDFRKVLIDRGIELIIADQDVNQFVLEESYQ